MSLKAELEIWVKALDAYDSQDFPAALSHFEMIADSSKVLFNLGLIHATLANHRMAVAYYEQAHLLDQYLAVSFFQCGVSHFLLGDFTSAEQAFSNAYVHMRENQIIDYEQLGLKFRLYSAEILFNQGLTLINLARNGASQQAQSQGMALLDQARKEKQTDEHKIIEEAYAQGGQGFTVFSVPVGVLFRPSPIKLKNLKAKNYLGNAKLVAATDPNDAFIGFSGLGARAASPPPPSSTERPQISPINKLSPIEMARKRSQSVSANTSPVVKPSKPATPPPTIPLPVPPLPLSVQAALARAAVPPPLKQQHQQQPFSQDSIRPLKIQKSSPDLRATRTRQDSASKARPDQLPRLNTAVTRSGAAISAGPVPGQIYVPGARKTSMAPASGNMIATTMLGPPSPPESAYSEEAQQQQQQTYDFRDGTGVPVVKQSRRTTSDTTLVYRSASNAAGIGVNGPVGRSVYKSSKPAKRDTEFMEELIGGYSATSLSPLPEQLPPPVVNAAGPIPQGQPRERVERWASSQQQNQAGTLRSVPSGLARNGTGSSGVSGQSLQYHAASSRGANRRRYQTEGQGSYLNSRYMEDDRPAEMLSFRLKLHFEDDIRGMSLDADTSYTDFYTRLQTKFGIADMKLKYQDEDGVFVTLVDETDWDSAVAAAREHCPSGRQDGKLEIWISEIQ